MKRITWIDNFKYFCIMAVMAEHAPCMTGLTDALNASFYISGFFFASGYLYTHRDSFPDFLKKKIRQLFIPWFFLSTMIVVSGFILSFNEHHGLGQALIDNYKQIRLCGDEMWFVAALFVSFIPFYFLIDYYEKGNGDQKQREILLLIGCAALSVLSYLAGETTLFGGEWHHYPWHPEYIFRGCFLMLLGYFFRKQWEPSFDQFNSIFVSVGGFVLLLAITWGPQFAHYVFTIPTQTAYHYLSGAVGIPVIISLSKLIPRNAYMTFVGRNTILYYAFHGKVESLLHAICLKVFGQLYRALCWSNTSSTALLLQATIASYLYALAVSVILIIPVYLVDRYLPVLAGRTPPPKKTITDK